VFVANFLFYSIAKYFSDRPTTHRVIANNKMGARFFETQCTVVSETVN